MDPVGPEVGRGGIEAVFLGAPKPTLAQSFTNIIAVDATGPTSSSDHIWSSVLLSHFIFFIFSPTTDLSHVAPVHILHLKKPE